MRLVLICPRTQKLPARLPSISQLQPRDQVFRFANHAAKNLKAFFVLVKLPASATGAFESLPLSQVVHLSLPLKNKWASLPVNLDGVRCPPVIGAATRLLHLVTDSCGDEFPVAFNRPRCVEAPAQQAVLGRAQRQRPAQKIRRFNSAPTTIRAFRKADSNSVSKDERTRSGTAQSRRRDSRGETPRCGLRPRCC